MQILNKNKTIVSLIALLAVAFVLGTVFDYKAPEIEASLANNVSGWAWANTPQSPDGGDPLTSPDQGVGWISFNSTNCDSDDNGSTDIVNYANCPVGSPSTLYGVTIDPGTGNFSGNAWSENIGWIDFAPTGPYPPGLSSYSAKLDSVSGHVTGWVKALSADGNGWDGWISLAGDGATWNGSSCVGANDYLGTNRCNYGVKLNLITGDFEGYAWGSDVVGWIDFNPAFGGVVYNNPPPPPPPTTKCNDGKDNDGDGLIDHSSVNSINPDPGCSSETDTTETRPTNFTVNALPSDIKVQLLKGQPGTSEDTIISITMIDTGDPAFGGPVNLSVDSTTIPGATYNWSSSVINAPYSGTVTFSVNVPAGTPDGAYTLTIRGDGGVAFDTKVINLNSKNNDITIIEI